MSDIFSRNMTKKKKSISDYWDASNQADRLQSQSERNAKENEEYYENNEY